MAQTKRTARNRKAAKKPARAPAKRKTPAAPPPEAAAQNRLLMIGVPAVFAAIALWQMAAGRQLHGSYRARS